MGKGAIAVDPEFWITAWNEGRTSFHQKDYHEKLVEYFPQLNPEKGQKILVPLCGKTKDLLWLQGLGLHVHGVELYEQAVEAFFKENELSAPQKTQDQDFVRYTHGNIVLSCGDVFQLNEKDTYDFIYDRGSLVAFPLSTRQRYAQTIARSLRTGGKYLLIVYEYDQSQLEGPPFSVDANEIHALYEDQFNIKLMESKKPSKEGPRLSSIDSLKQKVYVLEKMPQR